MKMKSILPLCAVAAIIILAAVFYGMPKTFAAHADPTAVDHINVFDGNTGVGFTIDDPDDIRTIVENIQSHPMKRDGISLHSSGYSFKVSLLDSDDRDLTPPFIINSSSSICKDPFFYTCSGGLCFDTLQELEAKYSGN